MVLDKLKENRKVAAATHNIYAYRWVMIHCINYTCSMHVFVHEVHVLLVLEMLLSKRMVIRNLNLTYRYLISTEQLSLNIIIRANINKSKQLLASMCECVCHLWILESCAVTWLALQKAFPQNNFAVCYAAKEVMLAKNIIIFAHPTPGLTCWNKSWQFQDPYRHYTNFYLLTNRRMSVFGKCIGFSKIMYRVKQNKLCAKISSVNHDNSVFYLASAGLGSGNCFDFSYGGGVSFFHLYEFSWRFVPRIKQETTHSSPIWLQGCEDDGEIHAGNRMLHLLQVLQL